MLALLVSLKGTVLIYQGEELGLPEADLRRDQLKDPVGDLYYPLHKGRDGCRVPMPWQAGAANYGFTTGQPWLPMAPEHKGLEASAQDADPGSTLNLTRRMLAIRRQSDALCWGEIVFRDVPAPLLVFERVLDAERIVCAFNMSATPVSFVPDRDVKALDVGGEYLSRDGGSNLLAAYGFWLGRR
jgi:alpha-glucosidase